MDWIHLGPVRPQWRFLLTKAVKLDITYSDPPHRHCWCLCIGNINYRNDGRRTCITYKIMEYVHFCTYRSSPLIRRYSEQLTVVALKTCGNSAPVRQHTDRANSANYAKYHFFIKACWYFVFSRPFAKLRKATIRFYTTARLSFSLSAWKNSAPTDRY